MRGDAANLSRVYLVRLAMASAATALVSMYVYGAGNAGTLSDAALLLSLRFTAGAGLAAMTFSVAGVAAALAAPAAGARISPSSMAAGGAAFVVGLVTTAVAATALAVSGGLPL